MDKRVLIISSELTLLEDYYERAQRNKDILDILLVGMRYFGALEFDFNGNIIKVPSFDTKVISSILKESDNEYDYIFSYDEKLLSKIGDIANAIGAKTYNLSSENTRDKYILKKFLEDNNLPFPEAKLFSSLNELYESKNDIQFPIIVKPASSYGSNGVRLVNSKEELKEQAKNIFRINMLQEKSFKDKKSGIIVEQYISEEEYSVEIVWYNSRPICSGIMSRIHVEDTGYFPDYVYYIDPFLNEFRKNQLFDIAKAVGNAIGMKNGTTHTEIRYEKNNPYVIENAARPGGGGYLFKLFSNQQSIDFMNIYYQVMTDGFEESVFEIQADQMNENEYFFLYSYPFNESGRIKDIQFKYQHLNRDIRIISNNIFLSKEDKILASEFGFRYSFFILGKVLCDNYIEFKNYIRNLEECCCIEFYNY